MVTNNILLDEHPQPIWLHIYIDIAYLTIIQIYYAQLLMTLPPPPPQFRIDYIIQLLLSECPPTHTLYKIVLVY